MTLTKQDPMGPRQVIKRTCADLGVAEADVLGPRRFQRLFAGRALCAARLRDRKLPLEEIAHYMNRASHASVLNMLGRCPWKRTPR